MSELAVFLFRVRFIAVGSGICSPSSTRFLVGPSDLIILDQPSGQSASATDGDVDRSPFRISVEDSQENLVGLAVQLAWLAAFCRISEFNQASYSQISFNCSDKESNSFEITPLPLQRVQESTDIDPATCWLPICKRGIIARGFPIPDRQAEKGIELPFSLMTDQAGILYPVKYKGKVCLRGFSCILFPTSASNNFQAVQWHLVYSGDSNRRLPHGTLPKSSKASRGSNAQWLKSTNMKGLSTSPRTFLGYCKHVEVHLCTEQGSINRIQVSGARTEKHRSGLLWKSVTAGFPGKGFLSLALGADITRPRGLAEEAKERRLQPMLNEAMDTPVIISDLASDRAWLVPTISVILLMSRVYAREDPSLLAKLPPATPSWDAATEAMTVIRRVEGMRLPKEIGESDGRYLNEVLHDLLVAIDSKIEKTQVAKHEHKTNVRTESKKLYGWELLDIARERRGNRKQTKYSASWTTLADEILVLFGRDFGDIIRPASDSRICAAWNPLPAKSQYLTATIKCLQDWSRAKWGPSSIKSHCLKFLDEGYWQPEASLFADCRGEGAIPRLGTCYCAKKPQHLSRHAQPSRETSSPPGEGGVIFGSRKLRKTRLYGWQQNDHRIPPTPGHAIAAD